MLDAARAVIAERGLDRFSLRETARRAGVSASAPAHHFGDARGLLTALAAEAYRQFGAALAAADQGGSRSQRIRSQGLAYVRFALEDPARFDLMWRYALIDRADPDFAAAAQRAFAILDRAVRQQESDPCLSADPRLAPSIAAWSLVHGFTRLALDGAFGTEPGAAERASETLLPAVLEHLSL